MKVVDDSDTLSEDQFEAVIITGDGRSEYRRFRPLFDHYDDDKQFLLPSRPERHITPHNRSNTPQRRGWEALDIMTVYKSSLDYGYSDFLFVVDAEHCDNNGRDELKEKLIEIARNEEEITIDEIEAGAYISEFQIGSQDIMLYTAVVGEEEFGFIEDCLGNLLRLEWGVEIDAENKQEFKNSVEKRLSGNSGKELLRHAERDNLDQAFNCLSKILKQFE